MLNKVVEQVIHSMQEKFKDKGNYIRLSSGDLKLEIQRFSEIIPSEMNLAYIDGGNTEIIGGANFSLQLIRVCCVVYVNGKRKEIEKKEFFVLINIKGNNFTIKKFGEGEFADIEMDDELIKMGGRPPKISVAGNVCRRISEIQMAREMSEKIDGAIILDGSLEVNYPNEKEEIDLLFDAVRKRNLTLGALSKTSRLVTDTGYSAIGALQEIAEKGKWHYKGIKGKFTTCFLRLHANAKYIFRFDYLGDEQVVGALTENAKDPVFLGYPYGLIDADSNARVTNREREYYRTLLLAKAGELQKEIFHNIRTTDAHSILDNIY